MIVDIFDHTFLILQKSQEKILPFLLVFDHAQTDLFLEDTKLSLKK